MAGLVLIKITGIHILDPVIAIIVALFIFKAGFSISKETLNNLLDGSLPKCDIEAVEKIIENFKDKGVHGYKSLKGRNIGPEKQFDMTLLFPKRMTIEDCHKICDEIEAEINKTLGNCIISIHAEPEGCEKCSCKS